MRARLGEPLAESDVRRLVERTEGWAAGLRPMARPTSRPGCPGPMTQRELAAALFASANTLKTHLRAIYPSSERDRAIDAPGR